ncbi:30872_t:CDS:2, partial [Gigaspora margarita]
MDRYEEEMIEYQDYGPEGNITNQKALSDMGWEDSINDEPHKIYIRLDDLVSQYEATLEKETLIFVIWCGGKRRIPSDTTRLSPPSNDAKPCKSVTAT